jgi:hypothetical protein
VEGKTLDQEAIPMRKLSSLALVLLAAGVLAAGASGGTGRHRAGYTSGSSIASIADASTSWAEFSAKVPDLPEALTRESQATLAGARQAATSKHG